MHTDYTTPNGKAQHPDFALSEPTPTIPVIKQVPVATISDRDLRAMASPRRKASAKTRRKLNIELGRRYMTAIEGEGGN